jgi:FAD/FMN-containing dehydrogenase
MSNNFTKPTAGLLASNAIRLVLTVIGVMVCMQCMVHQQQPSEHCGIFRPKDRILFFDTFFSVYENSARIPLFFPKSELELSEIVSSAKANQCKVRVRGAGRSAGEVIKTKEDRNVVIVHLLYMNSTWQETIDEDSCIVTIGAGKSLNDMMHLARPKACLMKSSTAQPIFSVGGIMSSHIGGNGFNTGFLYDHVVGVRVMNASGAVFDVTEEDELRKYRGAEGFTGIVLAYKYQLQKATDYRMSISDFYYDSL